MPEPSTNNFGVPLPVFRVKNVDASIAHYLNALGFELRWRAGDGFACAREFGTGGLKIFLPDSGKLVATRWKNEGTPLPPPSLESSG
jgi:hypothetical protein